MAEKLFRSLVIWALAMLIHVGNMCYGMLEVLLDSKNYSYDPRYYNHWNEPIVCFCVFLGLMGLILLFLPGKRQK